MNWKSVDTQADLDELCQKVCWEDSETIEFYGKLGNEPYFPDDISRSGHRNQNIHVLCRICSHAGAWMELVLIDCDWFYFSSLRHLRMQGKVDSLRRVDLQDEKKSTLLRCSRLIYRFLTQDEVAAVASPVSYFRYAPSVT